jgi:putative ABC transport system permease protein
MRILDVKLVRDLARLWAQALVIALVLAAGVAVLVLAIGAQRSLHETREAYYERNRFGDIFATVTRAPKQLLPEIEAIPGVARAEGRIASFALLDIAGLPEPASARVISIPPSGQPAVNLPTLKEGRLPDPSRPEEVAVNEGFALAHGFRQGDGFAAILHGQRRELVVVGVLYSPEFIYTIAPGAMMPDDLRFAVLWMAEESAAAALDLDGAFNDLSLRLSRGASETAVIAAVDRLLAPYGGTGAHGRDRQVSHSFLDGELEQLRAMAVILPPVFFVISAFLVNMVLSRLVALERSQIGLLKALGYRNGEIAWHYVKLALLIGVTGVLIGWASGWWAGRAITEMYGRFYRFPYLLFVGGADMLAISGLAALAATVGGALRSVGRAVLLQPAVAMAPAAPVRYHRGAADGIGRALGLPQLSTMILRNIARFPGRAAVTVFGVAASVATLVASLFTFDAMDHLIDLSLYRQNRMDVSFTLVEPKPEVVVTKVAALPGVIAAEGMHSVPVRLVHGSRSRLTSIDGRGAQTDLTQVLDRQGSPVPMPDEGLLLPDRLAERLGVGRGDRVTVELLEGTRETVEVPVAGLVAQYIGEGAYMDADALARLLRRAREVNRVDVIVDDMALPALYAAVKETPAIAGLTLLDAVRVTFRETLRENLTVMSGIYTALGALIAVGVVYNAARIQLSERTHELASLRVLGFTRAEVSYVLVGELMLLTVVALPIGWGLGYLFASLVATGFSTDIVTVPLVVGRGTFGYASVTVFLAALGSALIVRRQLDRLDLVAALKTRE